MYVNVYNMQGTVHHLPLSWRLQFDLRGTAALWRAHTSSCPALEATQVTTGAHVLPSHQ